MLYSKVRDGILRILEWLGLRRRVGQYTVINCDALPEMPKKNVLYVLGDPPYEWAVGFLCPCNCGALIQLNLLPKARPCWKLKRGSHGEPSLYPSVWRKVGCKSHFFLEEGEIKWV